MSLGDLDVSADSAEALRRESISLRRGLRDLVAFAGLRTLWIGRTPAAIGDLLADALINALQLDLVYVRFESVGGEPPVTVLRSPGDALDAAAEQAVAAAVNGEGPRSILRVAGLAAAGELAVITLPVGRDGERGFLLVGSTRAGFPDDFERTLLGIGASEVAGLLAERESAWHRQNELLAPRLVQAQEEERHAVARYLHDEVGQMLTALALMIDAGGRTAPTARYAEMRRLVQEVIERVRNLSMDLRPAMLDALGLLPTLLWHVERFERQTGITVELRCAGLGRRGGPEAEITAFRVVQEALTNVAKHAGVAAATLEAWTSSTTLGLAVTDHGRGFQFEAGLAGPTRGLAGMRDRCRLAGGRLMVETSVGGGTRVSAELPLGTPTLASAEDGENA